MEVALEDTEEDTDCVAFNDIDCSGETDDDTDTLSEFNDVGVVTINNDNSPIEGVASIDPEEEILDDPEVETSGDIVAILVDENAGVAVINEVEV